MAKPIARVSHNLVQDCGDSLPETRPTELTDRSAPFSDRSAPFSRLASKTAPAVTAVTAIIRIGGKSEFPCNGSSGEFHACAQPSGRAHGLARDVRLSVSWT